MRKTKASKLSDDRRNWDKIFNGMVHMLRTQQQQLLSLVKERKFLEDRIRTQHDGWESDIRLYEDQITQMKGILRFEEKKRLLDGAKAELVLGLKLRQVSILKHILENTEDELADFKAWFDFLSRKSSDGEDQGKTYENTDKRKKGTRDSGNKSIRNMAEEEKCSNKLEVELGRLKREYEAALEKNYEVSAVLAEKKFVWNQYKIMENEYINKLRSKDCELEQASEKIERLVSSMEQLQSANDEKDGTISRLESKVASMEADTNRLNEELLKLSNELELLRKSRNTEVTPDLNRCNNSSKRRTVLKKEMSVPQVTTDSARHSEKESRSLKRKEGPVIPVSETPKLFSSNFKVPKLKNQSPNIR